MKQIHLVFIFLLLCALLCGAGCAPVPEETEAEPFEFSLVWNVYGISSYDSKTGKLVKTTDASQPERYVTTLILSPQQRKEVRAILNGLDLSRYPDEYDPFNAPDAEQRMVSTPSQTLSLTVVTEQGSKTVLCRNVCFGTRGYNADADAFLSAVDRLTAFLTSTPQWQALPEYEVYYD